MLEAVLEFSEPEVAEGREDFSFVGDAIGHDAVEGADAVGGDDQKLIAKIVNVADFAMTDGERQVRLEGGFGHAGGQRMRGRIAQQSKENAE